MTFSSGKTKPDVNNLKTEWRRFVSVFSPPYLKQPEPSKVVLGARRLRKIGNNYLLLFLLLLVEFMKQNHC